MAYQQNVDRARQCGKLFDSQRQLQTQAAQKYRAKAEQLQQNETDLSLRLTQQDAAQRLAIKMRLNNLALDPGARKEAQAQLAAIDAKETAALETQRNADAATLRAYRAQLDRETGDAIRSQVGAIAQQTRAKLEERRNEVGIAVAQPRAAVAADESSAKRAGANCRDPPSVCRAVPGRRREDDRKSTTRPRAISISSSQRSMEPTSARPELPERSSNALQKRRDDLYAQIDAQVERDAKRIAKEQGFSIVFVNIWSAAGGYDLTNELIKDVESQHE